MGDLMARNSPHVDALEGLGWNRKTGEFTTRKLTMSPEVAQRPLIDMLQEATFGEDSGLMWVRDKYAMRMALRKAHRFTLDKITSALVADFSMAIASDIEAARPLAVPPFPVTWIEIDNHTRLKRMHELGMTFYGKAGDPDYGETTSRTGWLIEPGELPNAYQALYCTGVGDKKVMCAPMGFWWHTVVPTPNVNNVVMDEAYHRMLHMCFGVRETNVNPLDATCKISDLNFDVHRYPERFGQVREIMMEIAGELRHIWAFLIMLGACRSTMEPQPLPTGAPPIMRNGKPLLPLEHKVLCLRLNKQRTVADTVARAITHHHNRNHDVRGHFRTLKSGRLIPVKSHSRGDLRLGRVEKTYKVEQ